MKLLYAIFGICCLLLSIAEGRSRSKDVQRKDPSPYHVHISVYDRYMFRWPASGVLISRTHVLTAAVNVYNYFKWELGFGSEEFNKMKIVTSFYGYVHENFNDTTDDNNVGLVVMPEPIRLTSRIAVIPLPEQGEHLPSEGDLGLIAAFSYLTDNGPTPEVLEHGIQKVMSSSQCEGLYPHLHGIVHHYFCGSDDRFNVCGGAQGSGLVIRRSGKPVLAGILSFGNIWQDCASKIPAGYIRISEYIDWINQKSSYQTEFISSKKNEATDVLGISY